MTVHAEHAPAPTSTVLTERVRDRIDDLRRPCTTTTQQWVREPGVDHLVRREVTVALPPLLVQLAQSVAGSTSGRGSSGTKARPPGSLEGTDTLRTITREAGLIAARILSLLTARISPGLQVSIRTRRLADALDVIHLYAGDLDRNSLLDVDAAVCRWWAHARVVTTWDAPPLKPWVPCPACRKRGGLQVVDQPLVMVCLDCGAAWDGATLGELEAVYRLAFPDPIDTPPLDPSLREEPTPA